MGAHKSLSVAALFIAACSLTSLPIAAQSQDSQSQQTESLADAARRARQEKKAAAKSAAKVITDDDLPTTPKPGAEGLNVGSSPRLDTQSPSEKAVDAVEAADQTAAKGDVKKGDDPEIKKLKEQIAAAKKDLDLLQRELALDQDTFYANTDYAHDKAGQTKLADEQQQINHKQQELAQLNARLAALQEAEDHKKGEANKTPQ
jgi:hypothetical protein